MTAAIPDSIIEAKFQATLQPLIDLYGNPFSQIVTYYTGKSDIISVNILMNIKKGIPKDYRDALRRFLHGALSNGSITCWFNCKTNVPELWRRLFLMSCALALLMSI